MDRLETNHLSHLQKQIDKIDARVWAIILGASITACWYNFNIYRD